MIKWFYTLLDCYQIFTLLLLHNPSFYLETRKIIIIFYVENYYNFLTCFQRIINNQPGDILLIKSPTGYSESLDFSNK